MNGFQWWMLMPFLGMGFGFFCMWLGYKRRINELDLLKAYIVQNKEPPAELLQVLQRDKYSVAGMWRGVAIRGALAVGFSIIAILHTQGDRRAFPWVIAAIILGALALGQLVYLLIRQKLQK